jgi:hypothetical protein
MNELIEKFIAESTICQGHPQIDGTYFDKEKFAELIVRECSGLCSIVAPGRDAEDIEEAIMKHFGVER